MGEELDALQIVPRYAPRTRPLPIPGVDAFDAPVTCLEINQFWVSHLLGALEVLDQPDAWLGSDQEIFLARQQVREIMLALTLGNCEGGPSMFDVRQSPDEPCLLEKTVDGLTWTPFAMLELCAQATTPPASSTYDDLRENPVTGELEFSLDGGVTWTDVPVPPGEPPSNPWAPARSPSPGVTTEERRCNAATRAAGNLAEMYRQTYGAIGAGLLTGLSQFSSFLQELNNLLAGIVWGTYFDIWQALGFQQSFEPTQYAAATLDQDAQDALTCLLYDNATVGNQGVVSFDFGAVRDNVISELGINPGTAVWTHLNYLQEAGLNRLGEVGFGSSDCSECEPIINNWEALGGDGRSGIEVIPYGPHPYSISWPEISDTYLPAEDAFKQHPRAQWSYLRLRKEFTPTLIHSWRMSWTVSHGQAAATSRHGGMNVAFFRNGVEVHWETDSAGSNALNREFALGGNPDNPANYIEADAVEIWFVYYLNGGSVQPEVRLTKIVAAGNGPAPL